MSVSKEYINQKTHNNLVVTSSLQTAFDSRWSQVKISGKNILGRSNHVAVFFNSIMYVHCGYEPDKGILSDFYCIDLSNDKMEFVWEKLDNTVNGQLIKLHGHSGFMYKTMIIIFGGQKQTGENNNNIYTFDILTKKWQKINTIGCPSPKVDSHSACLIDDNMFIYGGYLSNQAANMRNIYVLNITKMQWKLIYESSAEKSQPQPRSNACMIAYKQNLWVFGGSNGKKTLNDMWKFDLKLNKWQKIEGKNSPEPRRGHSMITYGDTIFLFGGITDVTRQKNDVYVYEFSQNSWSKIHTYTNSVYQCSPTLKKSRKQITGKSVQNFSIHVSSPLKSSHNGDQLMKKIMLENKHKRFLQKKKELMKQFNQKHEEYKQKRRISPTTQSMMKSLKSIGDQQDNKNGVKKEIVFDQSYRFIIGKKPCARNGQSVAIYNKKMYIFGGDRHLMSFNDLYQFDLEKGIKSLQIYRSK